MNRREQAIVEKTQANIEDEELERMFAQWKEMREKAKTLHQQLAVLEQQIELHEEDLVDVATRIWKSVPAEDREKW